MLVLVTGGSGFIGSHLCRRLLADGHTVHCIDNYSTGCINNNLELMSNPNFRMYRADICETKPEDKYQFDNWRYYRYDRIYHLAAAVGVQLVVENPLYTIRDNINATEQIMKFAHETNTPVFLASTSEVYGKSNKLPYREDTDVVFGPPTVGRWSYACSKLIDEFIGLAYHKLNTPVVIGRFFNTTGPRQSGIYGMVVPRFVELAATDRPITIYGDGHQTRCFCHVNDTVDAIVRLMDTPDAYGQIFNIGSTEEIAIRDLAIQVLKKFGRNPNNSVVWKSYDEVHGPQFDDMCRRVPNTEKIQKVIGWRPTRNLDEIIDSVITYQLSQLNLA